MTTTDLKLDEPGSLPKPGPVGRTLRFALGALCLWYVSDLVQVSVSLASVIWAWALYLFIHLGVAFVVSAAIGTPGCEMRAFHDLYSRVTGVATKEHYCPVGPLHPVDQWEARRARG